MSALGRFLITKKEKDIASFKTPEKAPSNENCAEDHPRKFGKEQNVPSQFYCSSEACSASSQTAVKLYALPAFASTGV